MATRKSQNRRPALGKFSTKDGKDTKTRLIDAAEELFALHGLEGVSTRQITAQAGQRNESAIHYHFGSRQNLIQAIVDRRSQTIERLRNLHLKRLEEEGRLKDMRGLCECIAYPQFDLIKVTGGRRYYVRFIDEVLRSHHVEGLEAIWRRNRQGMQHCMREMRNVMEGMPEDVFLMRFISAVNMIISGLASIERTFGASAQKGELYDPAPETENLLDMVADGLLAPVSRSTGFALENSTARRSSKLTWPPVWVRIEIA